MTACHNCIKTSSSPLNLFILSVSGKSIAISGRSPRQYCLQAFLTVDSSVTRSVKHGFLVSSKTMLQLLMTLESCLMPSSLLREQLRQQLLQSPLLFLSKLC